MTDKFEKANKLADELCNLSDNVIILSAFELGKDKKEEADKCIMLSRGNNVRLAIMLKHYLEKNKPVAAMMKLLDLIPNAYRTEEIINDRKD